MSNEELANPEMQEERSQMQADNLKGYLLRLLYYLPDS